MKNKWLIPRLKPNYNLDDWKSTFSISHYHNAISLYEERFAKLFECKYGTMFSHGRVGIYALLKIWGFRGVEVICPAYTCVVVPDAIVLSDNTPVFVDCEEDSFNMSLEGIEDAITNKTRVVIATHLFGHPMDVISLNNIVERASKKYGHKIYVIQDCAHSYGASWNEQLVTKYGDAAIFGSNVSKIINSIFGGMVITDDANTNYLLKRWRQDNCTDAKFSKNIKRMAYFVAVNIAFSKPVYSVVNWMESKGVLDYFVKYYKDGVIVFPNDWRTMPCSIEAKVGLSQIEKYNFIISQRQRRARKIIESFSDKNEVRFRPYDDGCTYSHLVALVEDRDKYVNLYRKKNIQIGILIEYSIPQMQSYRKYKTVETPNSDFYSKHTINFPLTRDYEL